KRIPNATRTWPATWDGFSAHGPPHARKAARWRTRSAGDGSRNADLAPRRREAPSANRRARTSAQLADRRVVSVAGATAVAGVSRGARTGAAARPRRAARAAVAARTPPPRAR